MVSHIIATNNMNLFPVKIFNLHNLSHWFLLEWLRWSLKISAINCPISQRGYRNTSHCVIKPSQWLIKEIWVFICHEILQLIWIIKFPLIFNALVSINMPLIDLSEDFTAQVIYASKALDAPFIHAKRKLFCAFWREYFSHESSMKINFYSQQFYTLSLYLLHTYFQNSNERYTWVFIYIY